jgi:hypothetical protein
MDFGAMIRLFIAPLGTKEQIRRCSASAAP